MEAKLLGTSGAFASFRMFMGVHASYDQSNHVFQNISGTYNDIGIARGVRCFK
jgi:hypothetical protein